MEFNELIKIRRSMRAYDETKKVTKEQIEELLKAVQLAPSWKNVQTGRYYVILSDEALAKVRAEGLPEFNQNNSKGAALIVTTYVKGQSGYMGDTPANEMGEAWGAYDLGLQNAYLVLKASDMGLDTLIMGIRNSDFLRSELQIPDEEEVAAVIAIGYRAKEPVLNKRKDLSEIAKFF